MTFKLIVDATGDIISFGWKEFKVNPGQEIILFPEHPEILKSGLYRNGCKWLRWDAILNTIVEIPEVERVKHYDKETKKLREKWKTLSQPEKIDLLARHLGLID